MPAIPLSEALPGVTVDLDETDMVLDALVILHVARVSGDGAPVVLLQGTPDLTHVTQAGLLAVAQQIVTGDYYYELEDGEDA